MKKKIKKANMTKFDYGVRKFAFVVAILFVISLAFLTPYLDKVSNRTNENDDKIALLRIEDNVLKLHLSDSFSDINLIKLFK